MARNGIEWRRRQPRRAAGRVGWTAVLTGLVCGPAWLIFAHEPADGDDGAVNPLSLVVPVLAILFGIALATQLLGLIRRPIVAADHYALTVRPGVVRTLVLPWAQIAELATLEIDEDPLLLIRCAPQLSRSGDWPRWWDQANLRTAKRALAAVSAYDLAVPMGDFLGTPKNLLIDLARWAPDHVTVANRGRS